MSATAKDDSRSGAADRVLAIPVEVKREKPFNPVRYIDDLVRQIANGATFGFADKLAGGVNTLMGGGGYDKNVAAERERTNAFAVDNPVAAFSADLAGGLMTGLPGAAKVMATKALPTVTKLGLLGGVGGGLSGVGHSDADLGGQAQAGATGAATGAVLARAIGIGANALLGAAGKVVQPVLDKFGKGPANAADRKLLEALTRDDMAVPEVRNRLTQLGPDAVLADAGGTNTRLLSEAVANSPGRAAQMATEQLEGRVASQPMRVKQDIAKATGQKGNYYETIDDLNLARRTSAAPLYEKAYAKGPVTSTYIEDVLQDPIMKEAMRKGMEIERLLARSRGEKFDPTDYAIKGFNEAGDPLIDKVPNMRLLDATKRGLDDVLEHYRDTTTGKLVLDQRGNAINSLRKQFVKELDDLNPDYAPARQAYAGPSAAKDAMAQGMDALGQPPEVIAKMVKGMGEADRDAFRLGVTRSMQDIVGKTPDGANATRRIFGNDEIKQRVKAAFGDDDAYNAFVQRMEAEQQFVKTRNEVLKNSVTARRQAAQEDLGLDPAPLVEAAKGNFGSAVAGGYNQLMNWLRRPSAAQLNELGPMLFDPANAATALDRLSQRATLDMTGFNRLLGPAQGAAALELGAQGGQNLAPPPPLRIVIQ